MTIWPQIFQKVHEYLNLIRCFDPLISILDLIFSFNLFLDKPETKFGRQSEVSNFRDNICLLVQVIFVNSVNRCNLISHLQDIPLEFIVNFIKDLIWQRVIAVN